MRRSPKSWTFSPLLATAASHAVARATAANRGKVRSKSSSSLEQTVRRWAGYAHQLRDQTAEEYALAVAGCAGNCSTLPKPTSRMVPRSEALVARRVISLRGIDVAFALLARPAGASPCWKPSRKPQKSSSRLIAGVPAGLVVDRAKAIDFRRRRTRYSRRRRCLAARMGGEARIRFDLS